MNTAKSSFFQSSMPMQDIRNVPNVGEFRRGVVYSWLRRLSLLISDVCFISLAWLIAKALCEPTHFFSVNWGFELSLIPALCISISIFAARTLYRAGAPRRA